MGDAGVLPLLKRVQEECGGVIPFHRFMREALYHPTLGYYSAKIADVGAGGDFSTSATLGNQLGASIAAWIRAKGDELGWRTIPVIEIGAGNGSLAKTVLSHLGWKKRLLTGYSIVETSPVLRKLQQKKLRFRGIRWHHSVQEALSQSSGRALIFSNELVDAFPCRLFERTDCGWSEVGVMFSHDNSLHEVLMPLETEDPWFGRFEGLPVGQRLERHDSYGAWLQTWRSQWRQGAMLTIDYGSTDHSTNRPRKEGTLRAYWKHQRLSGADLYARFGKQDLTADVNFSDLKHWGGSLGLKNFLLMNQREFISRFTKTTVASPLNHDQQIEKAGECFQVLEQIC